MDQLNFDPVLIDQDSIQYVGSILILSILIFLNLILADYFLMVNPYVKLTIQLILIFAGNYLFNTNRD